MRARWLVPIVAGVLVLATACGDDDGGGEGGAAESGGDGEASGEDGRLDDFRAQGQGADEDYDLAALADLANEEIAAYWVDQAEPALGVEFTPPTFSPFTSTTDLSQLGPCMEGSSYEDVATIAFYCPDDHRIAYDVESRPEVEFGQFGPVMVMAHEYGHALQPALDYLDVESVLYETQADCFAGVWVAAAMDGGTAIEVPDDALELGLAWGLGYHDIVGIDPGDTTGGGGHGSAFDRINAFLAGLDSGADACLEWSNGNPPPITQIPFVDDEEAEAGGNLPLDETVERVMADLDTFWSGVFEDYDEDYNGVDEVQAYDADDESSVPDCEETPDDPAGQAFYCSNDNAIVYDEVLFEVLHEDIGDMAVAERLARAYATAIQQQLELSTDGPDAALQADCLSGIWAGSVAFELHDSGGSGVQLSSGDLDEALGGFFTEFQETADDDGGSLAERMRAYQTGFFSESDFEACAAPTED